ncbi:hypothetical protein [Caballeronia sp. M1242]|uniref:hypothetical protein n=1 Tax=Caballeronia sp. M1242 TaxID=2814653 RepID=UPI0019CFE9D7|nr:hypothetical protein [Caballeronia sp. M1242]QSN60454.1 hypothetical protein JYK05_08710 [Caballeronia sp. M1242]
MQEFEKKNFAAALRAAFEVENKPLPSQEALRIWWTLLSPFSLEQVRIALSQHLAESRFAPTPSDVISRLPKQSDGYPGTDEAWAIALRGADERESCITLPEIIEALSIARPVLDGGDEIGARMAFREAYGRLIHIAHADHRRPKWFASLGRDVGMREAVVMEGVRAGRICIADARALVPALAAPEGDARPEVAEQGRARLRELVASLPSTSEKIARAAAARTQREREATLAAKARAQKLTDERQAALATVR